MEERLHPTDPPHDTNEATYVDPTIGSRQATSTTTVSESNHIYPADQQPQLIPSSNDDDDNHQQLIVSPSQRQQHTPRETYIIQFPREQIYRVPPPLNGEIAERHRKPEHKKTKKSHFSLPWIIFILVVFGILCGVIAIVYNLTLNPKTPTFTVEKLTVKPLKQTQFSNKDSINGASVSYEMVLEAKNPNGVNEIRYEEGELSLDYKGKVIGRSSSGFMAFDQDPKGIDEVEATVDGVVAKGRGGGGSLPKEVEESMKSSKVNKKVRLGLEMKVPLKMKTWLMTKRKELTFACDFEVSSLAPNKDTRIMSQDCKTS